MKFRHQFHKTVNFVKNDKVMEISTRRLSIPILIFLSMQCCAIGGAKILVICSMPAHSHYTLAFRLAKELANRKHQVTFINPFPQKTPINNLKYVFIEDVIQFVDEYRKTLFDASKLGLISDKLSERDLSLGLLEHVFNSENVKELLDSNETFDVVVIEHFMNEAVIGIAHYFKAPTIFISPLPPGARNNYLFANPAPSSYIPDIMGSFTKHMNFWQRLHNFLSLNFQELLREIIYLPMQRQIFKKYIKTDLELDDLIFNISLMLTNSHISVTDPIPLLPNIIEIGGYHVSPPQKLPRDLQQFLDNANEGVVLFSMGSNLKSKDLTKEIRNAVLKTFSKIKQKVLWKFEMNLPEAPNNVKIMKWLPQQDILAHPNVRAFITHGGLLSTIEAVYYGVPIIGIPVFGDQKNNIVAAASNGYAVSVPIEELTEEKLSWALNEILNNPKYNENVNRRSKLMHDQPLKPIDSAVYWIEHVIRHKGTPHFRSTGLELKWHQREMIDIFVFLIISSTILIMLTFFILKKIINTLYSRQKSISAVKKNK